MEIRSFSEILHAAGLNTPTLAALEPNDRNYDAMLFQPIGEIEGDAAGVRNHDRPRANAQFSGFLREVLARNADLAVTPEYSMPWSVLTDTINAGRAPSAGKLWVLGCESITLAELRALKTALTARADVLFEALADVANRFLDPLAYVFRTSKIDGSSERLVVLVQFKTRPMGDPQHYEVNNLQTGNVVYTLGGAAGLRLCSLICSDVFDFTDAHAAAIYDRTLVIHLQLNPSPRHDSYRQYREKLLGFSGDATELICLNWAADVVERCGAQSKPWGNISASAWYLRPDKFDTEDSTLRANHARGLYYTYLKTKRFHALFFNYKPAIFLVTASKVAHIGIAAPVSRRRGPQLTHVLVWEPAANWVDQPVADDGFADVAVEGGDAAAGLKTLLAASPISVERVLALSAGEIGPSDDWHRVTNLDSCTIDASEVIRRMTFCQDPDATARSFRIARLKLCRALTGILKTPAELPPSLADLSAGFEYGWSSDKPHCNVSSATGKPATVVYMGELAGIDAIDATFRRLSEFLGRSIRDDDARVEARQRLAVWSRDGANVRLHEAHRYVKIDDARTESAVDIARES